ncbi:MAG: efflux RND transporter periplasmic adaptor subunit [Candidatus Eremiobacteraeota bacterium]|nr:efflux RND transporter periplasmic adaptor subunit [Candidatus Eremiobacteraeota bacterium]
MKRTRNLIIIVIALAIIVAVAAFAGRRNHDLATVRTQTIGYGAFQVKLPETGVVQHPRAATVPTLVAGNIGQIVVRSGERVGAGQLLATIDNPTLRTDAAGSQADLNSATANISTARINEENSKVSYQAQVATAKSNLSEAQRVYKADQSLFANKAIARNQVDTDKAKLDQMQVAYDQAVQQLRLGAVTGYGQNSVQYAAAAAQKARITNQQNQEQLGFTSIVAPFSGTIQTITTQANDPLNTLRPGDPVTAGEALFTIAANSNYIVKAQVDEQDIINVRLGQQANVTSQDFPGKTLAGHVTSIAPVATASTNTSSTSRQVLTTVQLDSSPAFLKDGMNVDVDILTTNVPHAITLPSSALLKDKRGSYVWIVNRGTVHRRSVKTGLANDTQAIVKSGLLPGDVVVNDKTVTLTEGEKIKATTQRATIPAP